MWHKIYFNSQNIKYETYKATLIKMPMNSKFSGYSFWHPSKLVRVAGAKGFHCSFLFTENFEFTIRKYNKNLKILDEKIITSDEMITAFEQVNNHIKSVEESYLIVSEPIKIDKDVDIMEDLKR